MDENEQSKIRNEQALESLNAIYSAVRVAEKWMNDSYPHPFQDHVEEQTFVELGNNLHKAKMCIHNLSNTVLVRMYHSDVYVSPFVEEK